MADHRGPTWVEVGPGEEGFGWHHLPWGVVEVDGVRHPVVRIGREVVLLDLLASTGLLQDVPEVGRGLLADGSLNPLLAAGPDVWRPLRDRVRELLHVDEPALQRDRVLRTKIVRRLSDRVVPVLPWQVADYVDFYCSIHHATRLGQILRPEDEPLLPNWRHLPVGYHGRSGTVVVSGTEVRRPRGLRADPSDPGAAPTYGPTRRLDLELEVGVVVGGGTTPGEPLRPDEVDRSLFGFCLVNDWSARDVQAYEYRPLGPFLGKSFLTSVSPWIVPFEAVRGALTTPPPQSPPPAPHLAATRPWGLPAKLQVGLRTAAMAASGRPAEVVGRSDLRDTYWTVAQMLAHLTSNGAHLRPGDLVATGTVSGPTLDGAGCLMERSWGGRDPFPVGDEERTFLEDGDEVVLTGSTDVPGVGPVDWGECRGRVVPA